jgi:hypothetical protein
VTLPPKHPQGHRYKEPEDGKVAIVFFPGLIWKNERWAKGEVSVVIFFHGASIHIYFNAHLLLWSKSNITSVAKKMQKKVLIRNSIRGSLLGR